MPDGSWTWNVGDGKRRLDYRATPERQPISDGVWHQLAFSFDRSSREARLYHDGRNVAIYDISDFGRVGLRAPAWVAVPGPRFTPGPRFEGEVADFAMTPRALSPDEISDTWARRGERPRPPEAPRELRVLTWNILHGGREDGQVVGLRRTLEAIRDSGADVAALQEAWGSGPYLADALGWHLYVRSYNLVILSRFPIVDTHPLFSTTGLAGVTLDLGHARRLAVFTLWLDHLPYYRDGLDASVGARALVDGERETRQRQIGEILRLMLPSVAAAGETPLVVAGDFNSPSHLDWTENTASRHFGMVVPWPVSRAMLRAGFVDSYRAAHPDPVATPGRTWSPRFEDDFEDRIDFVYFQGGGIELRGASVLDRHPERWPSDHAAVLTHFALQR
jgi:endonuclease/exonuclease/phosphatase family metal-dependent hydrolase